MRRGRRATAGGGVDLLNGEVHVRKTYTEGIGVTAPKSNEARTVDLAPQARELLENWFAESGGDDGPVFEKETGGYVDGNYTLKRVLYPALKRAGVPRVGERGSKARLSLAPSLVRAHCTRGRRPHRVGS